MRWGAPEDLLATVSSFTLSKTSRASISFSKESRRFSNVLVRIVRGFFPVKVCGSRVTRDIRGYGTYPPGRTHRQTRTISPKMHKADAFSDTHPHLVEFIVLILKDQMVRCEMESADVRTIQLGTDNPLDLFRTTGGIRTWRGYRTAGQV